MCYVMEQIGPRCSNMVRGGILMVLPLIIAAESSRVVRPEGSNFAKTAHQRYFPLLMIFSDDSKHFV